MGRKDDKAAVSHLTLVVKNPLANIGDARDMGSISGSEISPEGGNGNPFQYSYLENLIGSRAWQATTKRHKEVDMAEPACTVNAIHEIPDPGS